MEGSLSPLLFDDQEVQNADAIALFVPGALAPIHIFEPAESWKEQGYSLVYYRLPGLDGLPLDHSLGIVNAARTVANFANKYPQKTIRLLGYSTGGAVVIEAAKYVKVPDVKIAALSPAVSNGGGVSTLVKSGYDIFASAIRARSLNLREIWLEYYRTLLYGRKGVKSDDFKKKIDRIVEQEKGNIVLPTSELSKSHTHNLRHWSAASTVPQSPENIAFFIGKEDPVFSTAQTKKLAEEVGVGEIFEYDNGGHLLFLTHAEVFDDILNFFEKKVTPSCN